MGFDTWVILLLGAVVVLLLYIASRLDGIHDHIRSLDSRVSDIWFDLFGADETVLESSAAKVRVKLLAHETR